MMQDRFWGWNGNNMIPTMERVWHTSLWNVLIFFVVLDVILRGMALWRAARLGQKWWFVALLLVNSAGILPLIYLLTHQEKSLRTGKR